MNKIAFTLAEVLITLTIVGIIASMTIPLMISSTNNQEIVAKLRKSYSNFASATNLIKNDCGGSIKNCLSNPNAVDNDATARQEIADLYKAKMNFIKECGDTGRGCFADVTYKFLSSTDDYNYDAASWCYKLVLNDGTSVNFDYDGGAEIYTVNVDLNGKKAPNQWGRDLFQFNYKSDNDFLPGGINNFTACTTSNNGNSCTAKVLSEGAINY